MLTYASRRIAGAIPLLVIVSFLSFLVLKLAPGDPAQLMLGSIATPPQVAELRHSLGLDKPLIVQYYDFLRNAIHGDFGESFTTNIPVSRELSLAWPHTLELAVAATFIALAVGIGVGILSAIFSRGWFDYTIRVSVLAGFSVPTYITSIILIYVFGVKLGWLPTSGAASADSAILPIAALTLWSLAAIVRMTRSSMLEVLEQDYILTARARGIDGVALYVRHALRPAMIPVATVAGLQFGQLVAGAVLTEVVFNWPGIGNLLITAISARDYPTVRGVILLVAATFIVVNLVVDIMYAYIDPRVRTE